MSGFFKVISVLIRNQWKYKPAGKAAGRALSKMLKGKGFRVRSVYVSLGLGEPDKLSCIVLFENNGDLGKFESSKEKQPLIRFYREELARRHYPPDAIEKVYVEFRSWEAIQNAGGLYTYLK